MTPTERLRGFLQELAALRERYGFEIGGCGDCGSPWVEDHQVRAPSGETTTAGEHLTWCNRGYVFQGENILGPGAVVRSGIWTQDQHMPTRDLLDYPARNRRLAAEAEERGTLGDTD